jgi:hypothetical protein
LFTTVSIASEFLALYIWYPRSESQNLASGIQHVWHILCSLVCDICHIFAAHLSDFFIVHFLSSRPILTTNGRCHLKQRTISRQTTGRQLRTLCSVLYRIISKRRYILAAHLLLRGKIRYLEKWHWQQYP